MYDSPLSLEEICLDAICNNLTKVFDFCYESDSGEVLEASCSDDETSYDKYPVFHKKFSFKDPEFYLCKGLSESLFKKLGEKNLINDSTLRLFSKKNTRLEKVKIQNARKVTFDGLKILHNHNVKCLECIQLKNICIHRILDCLNSLSRNNLTVLNVSKCTFIDSSRHFLLNSLAYLKNLKSLNVAYTEFNQQTLNIVCDDLILLEKLDISGTTVNNLNPLLKFSEQLISLTVTDLKLTTAMVTVILQLSSLRHLDISVCNAPIDLLDHSAILLILENHSSLQNLASLEISGWRDFITKDVLELYLQNHTKLKYIGLVLNMVVFETEFSERFANLVVAGVADENQIRVTLHKHYDRSNYVQKALYHLFQLSGAYKKTYPDIFELILPAMAASPSKFGVQMAATACLYNLTKGDLSKDIHPKLLSKAVQLTLNAMDQFPDDFQLQKNSLLTLCSDRILQDVSFERFRCAKLVLDSLCTFSDPNMNRMSVAICSILAAKVSTDETSELGARPMYMRKLLNMVQTRVSTNLPDITLKFTLSALWNLTDESAATCTVFLEHGGVSLFLNLLTTFREYTAIETKVLGLLNNIAEVEKLRNSLMINSLVEELHNLLNSSHIDVSYFAAGIVAHLASDGQDYWTINKYSRKDMLNELAKAVMQWKDPGTEMVAYRSFKPFFQLLKPTIDYEIQLWAVWAIHHVCARNRMQFLSLLTSVLIVCLQPHGIVKC